MWIFKGAVQAWSEPPLNKQLGSDEKVVAACRAFTGLLAYPLLNRGPMWGSTLWNLALTDRRLVAVQRRILPSLSREPHTMSVPLSDIQSVRVFWDSAWQANVKIVARQRNYEFKVSGFPRETYEFTKRMRLIAKECLPTAHD